MGENEFENVLNRPLNWIGRIVLLPRKLFIQLKSKVHKVKNEIIKIIKYFFKPYFKKMRLTIALLLFIAYFCAAMIIKNPFDYPKNANSTVIMKEYIFANNTSIPKTL